MLSVGALQSLTRLLEMLTRGRERHILSGGKNERNRVGNEHISVLLLLHMFMF